MLSLVINTALSNHHLLKYDEKSTRCNWIFALFFKEPILFSSSIAENIGYGVSAGQEVSKKDIINAARKANAYRFIKSFPKGINTIVGERGQMLSGWFMNFNIN